MKKRIIISGGGIAGMTAAKLLNAQGHEVIINDKVDHFTKAGFLLSLKSFGVSIMEEMGLKEAIVAASVPSEFMDFMDRNGDLIRRISYEQMNKDIEHSILITRGALHDVLYQSVLDDSVKVLLGTTITHIEQKQRKVFVTYSNGEEVEADLLLLTEGLRSKNRFKHFKEAEIEDFKVDYLGGKAEGKHRLPIGIFKTFVDIHKMLSIYPVTDNELALQCYIFRDDENKESLLANAEQLLLETFKDFPAEELDLLHNFSSNGLLFADTMGIVHTPDFVNGRIILLGDAAYCPTAFSGMGASLSIYGAKALAYFLKNCNTLDAALTSYNRLMQPIAQKFQGNARKNAGQFLPDSQQAVDQFKVYFQNASEDDISAGFTDQLKLSEEQLGFCIGAETKKINHENS